MKKQDFYFNLPNELIAQYPLKNRSDSKLLTYSRKTKKYEHSQFRNITDYLNPGDLLVMNDSKVIPARLYGQKDSGGKVELLVERLTGARSFLAHIKSGKSPKAGCQIHLEGQFEIEVTGRLDDLFLCSSQENILDVLNTSGHIPLPPYISREDEASDKQRYQTIYASEDGSVAAPTAGLHFDETVMELLASKGIETSYLTLHVGAGTFRPVRCDNIKEHKMHNEYFNISDELAAKVNETRGQGNRVIAVGTTSLRSLESAAQNGLLEPQSGETDIFIYPGYQFQLCNGLITNFHLPESTLLMLVSAFIGHQETMNLYQEAIKRQYRFFSYGDACLLL